MFSVICYGKQENKTYFELGKLHQQNSSYDSSIYYFNSALETRLNHDTVKAKILIERGKIFQLSQNYELALLDFNEGLALYKKYNNSNGIALASIYLAEFYRHLGELKKAESIILGIESLINEKNVHPKTKVIFYNRYAAILAETDSQGDEGVKLNSNIAIALSREYGFKNIEASSLNQLAYLQFSLKNESAVGLFLQALEIYKELNDDRSQVGVYVNLARFYYRNGEYEKGIEYCDLGFKSMGSNKWSRELKELYDIKASGMALLGRFEEAYLLSDQRMFANENFLTSQNNKNLKELEIKYEVDVKNKKIDLEKSKSKMFKLQSEQKNKEVQTYILISVMLAIILLIAFFAYYKIRKTNKILNQTIDQKEILLQEVHHRVKNNLTVLNSLLYIQADETDNEDTKLILNECQSRIQSMALVHQNLYDVDDASKVDLSIFIEQLVIEAKEIFGGKSKVKPIINVNNIQFDMSFTVFLGLIINELLTNSFKYAFDNNHENNVSINLENNNGNFILNYSDSGIGLPDDFDINKSGGFGFKLIKIMINQIHGKLDYSKKKNIFTIEFKKMK